MRKARIPILITCTFLIFLITGILIFKKESLEKIRLANKDRGTASASTDSSKGIIIDNNTYIPTSSEYDDNNANKEDDQMSYNGPNKSGWTPATEMDLNPESLTVYVNKEHCLPSDYVPENLVVPNISFDSTSYSERKLMRKEAAEAIEELFKSALDNGIILYGISGYRSYDRQKEIFLNNIVHKGKYHTLKYSAAPGTSEHQTGLAMDVSSKSVRYKLVTAFAYSDEGIWLANNAHKFGFIIRYPKDQYASTGYAYEPWHIRYVGEDLASYLYAKNMTLDEYYKYEPSEGFDYEKEYADLINYRPPVTPTPIPEELDDEDLLDDLVDEDIEDGDENDELLEDETEDENLLNDDFEDRNPDEDLDDESLVDENLDGENLDDENMDDENLNDPDFNDENSDYKTPNNIISEGKPSVYEDSKDKDISISSLDDEALKNEALNDEPPLPTIIPEN
jgi:D-alanyl-D-alanine carboxypeptidase